MRCPGCGSTENKVIESRHIADGSSIRRRRECIDCGYRFTSYEQIEEKMLMVIKRDNRREEFTLKKLAAGIQTACEKRPISQNDINQILLKIEEQCFLIGRDSHEISSEQIGEMVMESLKQFDVIAYIRFASVYRNFDQIDEFIKEVEKIKKQQKKIKKTADLAN